MLHIRFVNAMKLLLGEVVKLLLAARKCTRKEIN